MMKLKPDKEKKKDKKPEVKQAKKGILSKWGKIFIILISTAVISYLMTGLMIKKFSGKPKLAEAVEVETDAQVLGIEAGREEVKEAEEGEEVMIEEEQVDEVLEIELDSKVIDKSGESDLQVEIMVPTGDAVLVFGSPGLRSKAMGKIWESQLVELLNETEYWAKVIGVDKTGKEIEGWVSKEFIKG